MRRSAVILAGIVLALALPAGSAGAQSCARVVVFTLPGTTWHDVDRFRPPRMSELAERGAAGSMSVRTNSSRTSLASGYVTLGAGTRMDGGRTTGGGESLGPGGDAGDGRLETVRVGGMDEVRALADQATYDAVPGALADALGPPVIAIGNGDLGLDPPTPIGHGRWTLLSATDPSGIATAAVDAGLLRSDPTRPFGVSTDDGAIREAIDAALALRCSVTFIEHGDLTRVDELEAVQGRPLPEERRDALLAADELLGETAAQLDLDRDLLLIVSPTSPAWDPAVHFGVVLAAGPRFPAGRSLVSPSTGRSGIVTLPDVAPTILEQQGVERPPSMLGRSFTAIAPVDDDVFHHARELDDEAVFIDRVRTPVSTIFVIFQVIVYVLILWLLMTRREHVLAAGVGGRLLEFATLAVVALPASTYLMGLMEQNALGFVGFSAILIGVDAALVGIAWLIARGPLDRLLLLSAATLLLLLVDGVTGAQLQLNTVFSYSPIVAGRFAGFGNIAYSVIAATCVIAGTLIVHRWRGAPLSLIVVALLFLVTIVIDGAPQWGSDVGGIIALVPGLGLAWLLLSGRKPTWRVVLTGVLAMLMALAIFLAVDLARPEDSRTHLARLYEDVTTRGIDVFLDTVVRKVRTNLRVFTNTIWTYLVPFALLLIGWLFLRPRGRWDRLAITHPRLRAGLISALILSVIGFFVNDSGIVIPALMLSFIVPFALFIHLSLERGADLAEGGSA
ncbi:MAG: hypothetical protein GEU78_01505 [Actinobacteria bacterium]|nr:hypothetical protein [Actinomycetota bacterium]